MACFNSAHRVEDHFVDVTEMIEIGSGIMMPIAKVLAAFEQLKIFGWLRIMVFEQTTIDTANRLAAVLGSKPWFSSVGISTDETGDVVLIVYLKRKPRKDESRIPTEWEGVPIKAQQLGKVRPAVQEV